jgi:hypothetical protein
MRIAPFLSAMCPPSYTTPATLVLLSTRGQKPGGEVTTSLKFHVNEADNDLVVTIIGTAYMVRYRRADTGLKLFHSRGDERAAIHGAQFLARAGQLANRRAEELGWFASAANCDGHARARSLRRGAPGRHGVLAWWSSPPPSSSGPRRNPSA